MKPVAVHTRIIDPDDPDFPWIANFDSDIVDFDDCHVEGYVVKVAGQFLALCDARDAAARIAAFYANGGWVPEDAPYLTTIHTYTADQTRPYCPKCGAEVELPDGFNPHVPYFQACPAGHFHWFQLDPEEEESRE
jgi:hypothetical protein